MATSTTPATDPPHQRSTSHSRNRSGAIPSRPTTPLRPPSRTSLRASQSTPTAGAKFGKDDHPLSTLEPAFGEFSDAMADLEANMMHLQLLHESLGRFNENFGAFLYGMNMSAFCVDFPEAPIPQSFTRPILHNPSQSQSQHQQLLQSPFHQRSLETDATFLTNDTSFVENPPTSSKPASRYSSVLSSTAKPRGSSTIARGAGRSGIARGSNTRGGRAGRGASGSGIARGAGRGRGGIR